MAQTVANTYIPNVIIMQE